MKRALQWSAALCVAAIVVVASGKHLPWQSRLVTAEHGTILAVVERRSLEVAVEVSGRVEPVRVVEVKSRASGELRSVKVEIGDVVEARALLAEIDPRDVQNALDQAEADVGAARVRGRVAARQLARVKRLVHEGVVPEHDLDTAETDAAAATSAILRAETNLSLTREQRDDVSIRAPIAGTILESQVEPGQIVASATANVSGGSTLFKMASLAAVRVRAKVDEVDVGKISPGQQASVTVEAIPSHLFQGEVERIEPLAVTEQNVTLYPVLVRLENPEGLLMPGMSAEVSLEVDRRENVLAVPNGTVVEENNFLATASTLGMSVETARAKLRLGAVKGASHGRPGLVFIETPSGPEPRRVTFGLSDWESTEVIEGVTEGERVYIVTAIAIFNEQRDSAERIRERSRGFRTSIAPRSPVAARGNTR